MLQSQLGITEAQMPLWTAFAQAMRDNAASTDALFARRAAAVAEMNAVDNMHSYAQIARTYADNTERLATAFDSLYASLSETQRAPPTRCSANRRPPPPGRRLEGAERRRLFRQMDAARDRCTICPKLQVKERLPGQLRRLSRRQR